MRELALFLLIFSPAILWADTTITQGTAIPISIARFDNHETVTVSQGSPQTLDDATAAYLLKMRAYDETGALATGFTGTIGVVEITPP